ncbi:GNAT family N-acetyltransferase [Nocardia terpenica]|uniref:N-acetyltransferase domain-containing protein n=1 Tax=Nocardia terpenica TaxID=455432 RepID=A0A6G9Z3B4_9NOCA|nr:GNAT family N-acetyltransferase [Nocardia terpenica]QIS19972.1 hypothetical protein F6W96_18400 [Nocardia terpenica]
MSKPFLESSTPAAASGAGPVPPGAAIVLRRARSADVAAIAALSAPFAARDLLLTRSVDQIHSAVPDFVVAMAGRTLLGCAGFAAGGDGFLLYNLCVSERAQGAGIGTRLIECGIRGRAPRGGELIAVSRHSGSWFLRRGFVEVPPWQVPQVWRPHLRPDRGSAVYRMPLDR